MNSDREAALARPDAVIARAEEALAAGVAPDLSDLPDTAQAVSQAYGPLHAEDGTTRVRTGELERLVTRLDRLSARLREIQEAASETGQDRRDPG